MSSENVEHKRLYYIDWLRVLVILTIIPFHASLTYLRYGVVPIFIFGYVYAANLHIQEKLTEYFKPSVVLGTLSLAALYFVNIHTQMFYYDAKQITNMFKTKIYIIAEMQRTIILRAAIIIH